LDSPEFIESQKIEKRIVRYNVARHSKINPKDLPKGVETQKKPPADITDSRFNYSYNPNAGHPNMQNNSSSL